MITHLGAEEMKGTALMEGNQEWPTTRWSQVARLDSANVDERCDALERVMRIYLPVLRRHLLNKRNIHSAEVDDLLQEFLISKIVKLEILGLAKQERGRFRTFLATALDRFAFNYHRDKNAPRRAAVRFASLEEAIERDKADKRESGEEGNEIMADDRLSPDVFDVAWARQVVGQTIRQFRIQCGKRKRPEIWLVFRRQILLPALRNVDPKPLAELADELKLESKKKASNLLITANRMFGQSLQSVIVSYDGDTTDVESEIRDLRKILSCGMRRSR